MSYSFGVNKTSILYYANNTDGTCFNQTGDYCVITFTPNQTIVDAHMYIDIKGFYSNH